MYLPINRSTAIVPLALLFLPLSIVPNYFDRNAPFNFLLLGLTAILCSYLILIKSKQLALSRGVLALIIGLLIATTISFLINDNKINMLTGDTGRYTGLVSLFALLLIAISYTQIRVGEFQKHLRWVILAVLLVDLLGLIQYLQIYRLPTGAGIGSTFGNSDFFSAWMGTTYVLIFALNYHRKKVLIGFQVAFTCLTLFLLWVIDVKQGFVDLIILLLLVALWRYRKKLINFNLGQRFWSWAVSIATILWFELIFLLPTAKIQIPFLTDDVQVTIRTHFWSAGMKMFFDHIPFGVGPDNYGNYYEQYRSLDSYKMTEFVLSNDAHSAVVQSFATLGLINLLLFTALWLVLVRAWVFNFFTYPQHRKLFLSLGAFFIIFVTNSMISPITLPNKFVFWAVAGFVIGAAAHRRRLRLGKIEKYTIRTIATALSAVIAIVLINFSLAHLQLITSLNQLKPGQSKVNYQYNPYLPCVIYFPVQSDLASTANRSTREEVAKLQLANNPRCLAAQLYLTQVALNNKDWSNAKVLVERILATAPARREVISVAAVYALAVKDESLQKRLVSQGEFLGLLSATGSVPQSPPTSK